MRLDLPPTERERLAIHAAEAGYDDVEDFVTEHVRAHALQPSVAELPQLTPEELQESLALIDKSMAEFEAGGGLTLEEARQRSLERFHELRK